VIDVDSFALHNAFEYNYPDAMTGVVVLVNAGHEISTVNVLQDGSLVLTRDVPFGSRRLREDLRRMHGLTVEEADAVLQGRSARAGEFQELLRQGAEDLAVGVERAVAFLGGDGVSSPGRVYVSGGSARIPGLVDVVAERLRARTEVATPLQRLRARPGVTSLIQVDEVAPMLMLAVGLALRPAA
jgi:type IV pilus assembly protein PilM